MNTLERAIKTLLGIPEDYRLYSLTSFVKRGKKYYKVMCYEPAPVKKMRSFSVPKAKEKKVLSLWEEYERIKEKRRELKRWLEELEEEELDEFYNL